MSSPGRTALVVEDDPEIRKLIGLHLERLGFTVAAVSDGRAAIKLLGETRPGLLCVDIMLPETSGFDVCEFVARTPALLGLPLIIISGRTLPADRALAEEMGAHGYLTKPFTRAQFDELIQKVLPPETRP